MKKFKYLVFCCIWMLLSLEIIAQTQVNIIEEHIELASKFTSQIEKSLDGFTSTFKKERLSTTSPLAHRIIIDHKKHISNSEFKSSVNSIVSRSTKIKNIAGGWTEGTDIMTMLILNSDDSKNQATILIGFNERTRRSTYLTISSKL